MASLRQGKFGEYYGSFYNESSSLSTSQQEVNAKYIYSALHEVGWTLNGVSALLGNMQAESAINPGRWQSEAVGVMTMGYGLVQWTPASKYVEWCYSLGLSDPSEIDNNIARIIYELEAGIQWYATDSYNLSFREFATSEDSPEYLAKAFLLNYERPADQSESVQSLRASYARKWYSYLEGIEPSEPGGSGGSGNTGNTTKATKKRFNFVLFNGRRRAWISKNLRH